QDLSGMGRSHRMKKSPLEQKKGRIFRYAPILPATPCPVTNITRHVEPRLSAPALPAAFMTRQDWSFHCGPLLDLPAPPRHIRPRRNPPCRFMPRPDSPGLLCHSVPVILYRVSFVGANRA